MPALQETHEQASYDWLHLENAEGTGVSNSSPVVMVK